ncbi:MAG: hypothetical protein IJS12_02010, partial [Lachnospiraceae bacterium]|nr:hypothetical protein [Lachnospiraceae bacterium]
TSASLQVQGFLLKNRIFPALLLYTQETTNSVFSRFSAAYIIVKADINYWQKYKSDQAFN